MLVQRQLRLSRPRKHLVKASRLTRPLRCLTDALPERPHRRLSLRPWSASPRQGPRPTSKRSLTPSAPNGRASRLSQKSRNAPRLSTRRLIQPAPHLKVNSLPLAVARSHQLFAAARLNRPRQSEAAALANSQARPSRPLTVCAIGTRPTRPLPCLAAAQHVRPRRSCPRNPRSVSSRRPKRSFLGASFRQAARRLRTSESSMMPPIQPAPRPKASSTTLRAQSRLSPPNLKRQWWIGSGVDDSKRKSAKLPP